MTVETDTERAILLKDFGILSAYTADGEDPINITVIFDEPYIGLDANGQVSVESQTPTVLCRASDVSNATHAASIVISGITYNVVGVQPDGTGFTMLALERQS